MSRKSTVLVFLPLFFVSLGFAQSLTEAAKKEKERREGTKGRSAAVTTNADLGKVKKKPAVPLPTQAVPIEGQEAGQAPPVSSSATSQEPKSSDSSTRYASDPQKYRAMSSTETQADLEAAWNRAKEYVELLNVKMLALQQQMAQPGSQPPKDQIQKEMNALAARIQQAQADEKKAKDALDKSSASQAQKR